MKYSSSNCLSIISWLLLVISLTSLELGLIGVVPITTVHPDSTSSLPETFDQSRGVKWKAKLPGASAAAPIIFEDRVFITSVSIDDGRGKKGIGKFACNVFSCLISVSFMGKKCWEWTSAGQIRWPQSICRMTVQIMQVLTSGLAEDKFFLREWRPAFP